MDKRLNCYFSSLNDDYLSLRNLITKYLYATIDFIYQYNIQIINVHSSTTITIL